MPSVSMLVYQLVLTLTLRSSSPSEQGLSPLISRPLLYHASQACPVSRKHTDAFGCDSKVLKHSAGGIAARRARRSRLRENSSWVQQEKSAFAVSRRTESSLTGASRETRKSHEKSRKNCLPGTDHSLYANRREPFPQSLGATSLS